MSDSMGIQGMGMGGAYAALANSSTKGVESQLQTDDRDQAAKGFEQMMMSMFVKEIRQTSGVKLFGESSGEVGPARGDKFENAGGTRATKPTNI